MLIYRNKKCKPEVPWENEDSMCYWWFAPDPYRWKARRAGQSHFPRKQPVWTKLACFATFPHCKGLNLHIKPGCFFSFWMSYFHFLCITVIRWNLFRISDRSPLRGIQFYTCYDTMKKGWRFKDGNTKHLKWIKCIPFRHSFCPRRGTRERERREGKEAVFRTWPASNKMSVHQRLVCSGLESTWFC